MTAPRRDPGLWLCVAGGVSALLFALFAIVVGVYGVAGEGGGPLGDPSQHRWNETAAYVLMPVVVGGLGVFLLVRAVRLWRRPPGATD